MTRYRRTARLGGQVVVLILLLAPSALVHGRADASPELRSQAEGSAVQPCCFKNPEYAGVCVVQPAEGETCGSILSYLNNPRSQGKSYCGNTSVRGGWTNVACPKASTAHAR